MARAVVSFTFDDARQNQRNLTPIFAAHPRYGYTLNIMAPQIGEYATLPGNANRMTWVELDAAVAAGAELGGHTSTHILGDTVTAAVYRADVQADIDALAARYPRARTFAYPSSRDGLTTDGVSIPSIIEDLGFDSARRGAWRLAGEYIPPSNRFQLYQRYTADMICWDVGLMQSYVNAAIAGTQGPWILTNAHECEPADVAEMARFLDWCETMPLVSVARVSDIIGTPWLPREPGGAYRVKTPGGHWARFV